MKSDAELQKQVLDELTWDPAINPTDVGVIVKDGVVTLTGQLSSYAEKHATERAAQRVSGVRAIAVELQVRLPDPQQCDDTDVATAAQKALDWNVFVPGTVQALVEKGWLTLKGEVQWDYQRKAAERAVRYLKGVVGVTNAIIVEPEISAGEIKQEIQSALERHAHREGSRLQVEVEGSQVTLRGNVDSWADLRAAQGAAWSAPGVTSVVNELRVGS